MPLELPTMLSIHRTVHAVKVCRELETLFKCLRDVALHYIPSNAPFYQVCYLPFAYAGRKRGQRHAAPLLGCTDKENTPSWMLYVLLLGVETQNHHYKHYNGKNAEHYLTLHAALPVSFTHHISSPWPLIARKPCKQPGLKLKKEAGHQAGRVR